MGFLSKLRKKIKKHVKSTLPGGDKFKSATRALRKVDPLGRKLGLHKLAEKAEGRIGGRLQKRLGQAERLGERAERGIGRLAQRDPLLRAGMKNDPLGRATLGRRINEMAGGTPVPKLPGGPRQMLGGLAGAGAAGGPGDMGIVPPHLRGGPAGVGLPPMPPRPGLNPIPGGSLPPAELNPAGQLVPPAIPGGGGGPDVMPPPVAVPGGPALPPPGGIGAGVPMPKLPPPGGIVPPGGIPGAPVPKLPIRRFGGGPMARLGGGGGPMVDPNY